MDQEWIPGSQYTAAELASRYEVPREEMESFREVSRIYPRGAAIIREGEDDKSLYLLRHGLVTVYKQISPEKREHIALIRAVNFFGEMSLLNDQPRSATVETYSEEALVYAVGRPNVNLILGNPRWGEMLLSRLSKDLARTDDQLAHTTRTMLELRQEIERLEAGLRDSRAELENQAAKVARVIAALAEFQKVIQSEAIVGSRGWAYLQALNRLTALMVHKYLPEVGACHPPADLELLRDCLEELEQKEPRAIYQNLIDRL